MRRSVWVAFGVLCVLSGSSWVIPDGGGLALLERQGLVYGLVGLGASFLARRDAWSWGGGLRLAVVAVGFFGVPMVVVEFARGSVGEMNRSALFAMVPVVVVLAVAMGNEERGARRFLIPALVGLAGLLLLLPLGLTGSLRGQLMLALVAGAVIVVGVASVRLYGLLSGLPFVHAVAV